MLIKVRVAPKASRNLVKKESYGYKVYLTKSAQEGLANDQLIGLLSDFFKVKRYQLRIVKGLKARIKTVELDG